MKHLSFLTVFILLILAIPAIPSAAARQDDAPKPLTGKKAREAIDAITSGYGDWDKLGFEGKLKSDILPMGISPTIKVFMQRGERLQMSVRAPFVGEVGALELTTDSILIVNKYHKTYCTGATRDLIPGATLSLDDLQSILLGRIVLPGKGELSRDNLRHIEITEDFEGGWLIYPKDSAQPYGAEYCCLTYPDGTLQAILLEKDSPAEDSDISGPTVDATDNSADDESEENTEGVSLLYTYPGKDATDIAIETTSNGKTLSATLSFSAPNPKASPLKNIKIPSGYTRTGISQLFHKTR